MINYENEISDILKDEMIKKTNIPHFDRAFLYYLTRLNILYPCKRKMWDLEHTEEMMDFILKELGITEMRYKDSIMSTGLMGDNSLASIFYNWMFRMEMEVNIELKELIYKAEDLTKKLKKRARAKTILYRKHCEYELFFKEEMLNALNAHFEVVPCKNQKIEGFIVDIDSEPLEFNLRYRNNLVLSEKTYDVCISEKELENFLVRHLDVVEEGLVYLGRQIILNHGIIDILSRDKNGKLVVIELKVDDDKDILWQEKYYLKEIRKKYKEQPRFIVIAPKISSHITQYLNTVELMTFEAITAQGKIIELKLKSQNQSKGA